MDVGEEAGGTSPSRAIARKTRGEPSIMTSSTDVMPATPAAAMRNSAQRQPGLLERVGHAGVLVESARTAPCPVSTATTAM